LRSEPHADLVLIEIILTNQAQDAFVIDPVTSPDLTEYFAGLADPGREKSTDYPSEEIVICP